MKISKKAIEKAQEIQKQIIKNNQEEMEMQVVNDFVKKYGICPQCAIPLKDEKLSFFQRFIAVNSSTKHKICKNCGFKVIIYPETYY
jgi:hypothetical protein